MTADAKRKTLACLLGLMILIAVIAAALPRLELQPGLPLPDQNINPGGTLPDEPRPSVAVNLSTFWKAILGIIVGVGVVYNSYQLLKGVKWNWKDVLRSFLYIPIPIVILFGILLFLSGLPLTVVPAEVESPPPILELKGPPLGTVPVWLIWLISLVCLGLAAALVGLGLWLGLRPPQPDRLKLEAERALQALKTGLDLKNVIVHCYWQMAQVLKQEQGLEMGAAMTVREFQRLLEARGVPPAPVQQLTQLFEAARYGPQPPGPAEESQAIDCLTAIVRYSQAGKRPH